MHACAVQSPIETSRNQSVDVCRLIAVIAVICLHVQPFNPGREPEGVTWWNGLYSAIEVVSRFAVPFFFCISGYFWGKKIRRGANVHAATFPSVARLFLLFVFWEIFYFLVGIGFSAYDYSMHRIPAIQSRAIMFVRPLDLLGGTFGFHLWFLPALLSAFLFAWLFVAARLKPLMLPVAVAFYVIAVLTRAYAHTRFGFELRIFGVLLDGRNGPFYSSLLFVAGYHLSGDRWRRHWKLIGPVLLAVGLLLHTTELKLLPTLVPAFQVPLWNQDYAFGTCLMGVGATLIALAYTDLLSNALLAAWGRMALGIYGVHLFYARLLYQLIKEQHSALVEIAYLLAVFFLSVLSVYLLAKIRWLKRFVQ